MEQVEVKRIRPSKRALRDELGPMQELMASIMEKGLLEPIIVRPVGDGLEVVAGNRRLEACRELKLRRIPCHIVELDDKEAYEVSLTENLQRRALDPIEEGRAFKNYVDDYGYGGESELARRIGKSHSYVSRRIALLSLPEGLKEEVVRRRMTPSVATEFLSLDERSRTELAEFVTKLKVSKRTEVRKLIKQLRNDGEERDNGSKARSPQSYYRMTEINGHLINRTLARCIASLKESMGRFDDAMRTLEDKDEKVWVVSESLLWHRRIMNDQVDDLLRLRRKIRHIIDS